MEDTLYIDSVGELTDYLRSRMGSDSRILWFRGHREADWELIPAGKRGYNPGDKRNFSHRFRSRAGIRYNPLPEYGDLAGWLALMQHYGLPTRLLDWSTSPLVALFFAAENAWRQSEKISDACVWVLETHLLNESQEGVDRVTGALNSEIYSSHIAPAFSRNAPEPDTVAAAMSSETDQRMFVQQGCFTIHSSRVCGLNHFQEFSYDRDFCE